MTGQGDVIGVGMRRFLDDRLRKSVPDRIGKSGNVEVIQSGNVAAHLLQLGRAIFRQQLTNAIRLLGRRYFIRKIIFVKKFEKI